LLSSSHYLKQSLDAAVETTQGGRRELKIGHPNEQGCSGSGAKPTLKSSAEGVCGAAEGLCSRRNRPSSNGLRRAFQALSYNWAKEREMMGWARLDERSKHPRKKRFETYSIKFGQNKPRLALMTPPTVAATALHRWNGKNNIPMPRVR
jgi:hypothetical protein